MSKYFHIKFTLKVEGKNKHPEILSILNIISLDEIENKYIQKYLKKQEFFFKSKPISFEKIDSITITETAEKPQEIAQRQMDSASANGMGIYITAEEAAFDEESTFVVDITGSVIDKVQAAMSKTENKTARKFYHLRIEVETVRGYLYRNDETDLSKIIAEVIKPYLTEKEFFFASRKVSPKQVTKIEIVETDTTAESIFAQYHSESGNSLVMGLTPSDAPFFCNTRKGTKNITQDLMQRVQGELPSVVITTKGVETNGNTSKNPRFFISYSSHDKEYIEGLVGEIKKLGIDFFYDKQSIEWGDEWQNRIWQGIKEADYAIIVFSKEFGKSEWTKKEQDAFIDKQKKAKCKILPILHNIEIRDVGSDFIKQIQAISSSDYSTKDITIQFARILLRTALGGGR